MRKTLLLAVLAAVLMGCASDEPLPDPVTGNSETVSPPVRPVGPDVVGPEVQNTFTTGGALSSEGDPVEYRFDFDADGAHDYTSWTRSSSSLKSWPSEGLRSVRAQARCEIHTNQISEWSVSKLVEVGAGPDTEISSVINTYYVGGTEFTELLNLSDAVPDTVPYGSWITLLYDGIPSPQGDSLCSDELNECLQFQKNYTWSSIRNPGVVNTIAWRPFDPEDTNPDGVADSTTMNVGTVEYTVRARSIDQFDRADKTPATIDIVGNFPPTLDSQSITNQDGSPVADGDTVVWDWWHPANAPDTVDTSDPSNVRVVKEFYFVIRATGHDHPKDPPDGGVKSWLYTFLEVGSNPPNFEHFNSRAGAFADGSVANVLSDTARVTFRYSLIDDPGGADALANLPDYFGKEFDYAVMGRDTGSFDRFEQKMFYAGAFQLINTYNTAEYGRWTGEGHRRFSLKMTN